MRENIGLFHGKRKDNGEWVEGYLYITHNSEYEIGYYNYCGFLMLLQRESVRLSVSQTGERIEVRK